MAAPTFVASYSPATDWTATTTPATQSVTVATNDVLVVLGGTEDSTTTLGTPSGGGLTYTLQKSETTASNTAGYGWTAAVGSSQTFTLSETASGGGAWGDIALRFSGSSGVGASANVTSGSGAGSVSITTTQGNSAIAVIVLDWNGVSGASRTWATVNGTTPTAGNGFELNYVLDTGNYTTYAAYYPDAGATGSVTVGLTAPTGMKYTVIAIEVKGPTSATVSAGLASGTGHSQAPVPTVVAPARLATGTGIAQQPGTITPGFANARLASGAGTAQRPVAVVAAAAGLAHATATAQGPAVALAFNIGLAHATATAQGPAITLHAFPMAGLAAAFGTAGKPLALLPAVLWNAPGKLSRSGGTMGP